jgi:filamentous hemagglutinin family protein
MKRSQSIVGLVLLTSIGFPKGAIAQVVPDNTVGTSVNAAGNSFTINGGMRSGNNLFHSFSQFSISTNGSAIFNNATDVQTIFSRITGSRVSSIDGLIRANGTASLFLMNPNGIVFGPNAKLDLGGSFVGTTADRIQFADQVEFIANNPSASPLLTVSTPIGLQMGQNPGGITVQGTGHQLQFINRFAPIGRAGQQTTGLRVNPNQTLALIGGAIDLQGGVISAPSGQIELGSVTNGSVSLQSVAKGWAFGYDNAQSFQDIRLSQRSSLDASGAGNASLQLRGRNIAINNGSIVILRNQAPTSGGQIQAIASESFEIAGTNPDGSGGSLLLSDAVAGSSAEMTISAPRMRFSDTGILASRLFGSATGGNISVNASEIQIDGQRDRVTTNRSGISVITAGEGKLGNTTVSAQTLKIVNGGFLGVTTTGSGDGGTLTVNASEIRVNGYGTQPSGLAASTLGRGNAGKLTINTDQLTVTNGGGVSTSTLASGRAGNLTVNASQFITIDGQSNQVGIPSRSTLASDANALPPTIRRALGITEPLTGASGDVFVTTPNLRITNGGQIRVSNAGSGIGGEMHIRASNSLYLNSEGNITAETNIGGGGNIFLQAQTLLLRDRSTITSTSGGTGNGGNITIDAPIIVGLNNSDIVANAQRGRGGTIQITTQSLFGLEYRDRLTPGNDITASSEFGINGTVQVNTIGINPTNALNALPVDITDSNRQIADRCSAAKTSSFIATGRGGIPQSPMKKQGVNRPWRDLRPIVTTASTPIQPIATVPPMTQLVEASAIQVDETGTISLIAPQSIPPNPATCATSMTHP